MGSYKWGYKSPNVGYKSSYPTYNPTHELPMNLQAGLRRDRASWFQAHCGFGLQGFGTSGLS